MATKKAVGELKRVCLREGWVVEALLVGKLAGLHSTF